MSKHDVDNRANQLNPNNPAYSSSRGPGRSDDDDDEYGAAVFTPPPVQASRPRVATVTHSDFAWPETMAVRYVTDEFRNGIVKVHVRRGEDIEKELANMWSTGKFLHLSCHNNGFDLFTGDRVEELTNPAELERAREALANSIGKSNKRDHAESAAILFGMSRRECGFAGLATYRF